LDSLGGLALAQCNLYRRPGVHPQRSCDSVLRFDASSTGGGDTMLKWALFFLVISIIAGLFGFTGISAAAAGIAKILFFIFIAIFVVLLIIGLLVGSALF
jgi:uncharacterized membrane protein YtjA (UPF0391 family)